MNTKLLQSAINEYLRKRRENPDYRPELEELRKTRRDYYQSFTKEKVLTMSEEDFCHYLDHLWSMMIWRNKKYIVDKLIADNGFEHIKNQLAELLYGKPPIDRRWDVFLKSTKGIGAATISELLSYADPEEYMILNKITTQGFAYLGITGLPKQNSQYTGQKYTHLCSHAKEIAKTMAESGILDHDLLAVDYFLWDEIMPLVEKK
jgi:hypothetical protein